MRIVYLVHLNLGPHSGVFRKVQEQAATWLKQGNKVHLCCLTRDADVVDGLKNSKQAPFSLTIETYNSSGVPFLDGRIRALDKLANHVNDLKPDIVYTRRDLYYPPIRKLAQWYPLIIEINSNEVAELRLHSRMQWLYHLVTRSFVDRLATGFVFVTHELKKKVYYKGLGKPGVVIANGIRLDALDILPPPNNVYPKLAFIANPAPWHGVDKLLGLARLFPKWEFVLIGPRPQDLGVEVPSNIKASGLLPRAEYVRLLRKTDVAIGTLALHRNDMDEACPLKNREYLAAGLPVIMGHTDTDFPQGAPYILKLPNCEDNVLPNRDMISAFVQSWKGRRVPRASIAHLDMSNKESQRLAFFRLIIEMRKEMIN